MHAPFLATLRRGQGVELLTRALQDACQDEPQALEALSNPSRHSLTLTLTLTLNLTPTLTTDPDPDPDPNPNPNPNPKP